MVEQARGHFRKLLSIDIEPIVRCTVLLSFFCTIIFLCVNWFLFAGWGLSYTVAASPSDVLVGAFETAAIFFPHLIIGTIAYSFGKFCGNKFSRLSRFAPFLTGACLLLLSSVDPAGTTLDPLGLPGFTVTGRAYFDYLLVWPVLFFSVGLLSRLEVSNLWKYSVAIAGMTVIVVSLVDGLQNRANNLRIWNDNSRCPNGDYVVWVGAERMVTSCTAPPFSDQQNYFVISKESVEMKSYLRSN